MEEFETLRGSVARRRAEPVGVEAEDGGKPPCAQEGFEEDAPRVAPAVSSAEKENGLGSPSSTGPDDKGGVAVMVLGNCTGAGAGAGAPGDSGWAVRGVSRYAGAYGVCEPCCCSLLRSWVCIFRGWLAEVLMAVTGVALSMAVT